MSWLLNDSWIIQELICLKFVWLLNENTLRMPWLLNDSWIIQESICLKFVWLLNENTLRMLWLLNDSWMIIKIKFIVFYLLEIPYSLLYLDPKVPIFSPTRRAPCRVRILRDTFHQIRIAFFFLTTPFFEISCVAAFESNIAPLPETFISRVYDAFDNEKWVSLYTVISENHEKIVIFMISTISWV